MRCLARIGRTGVGVCTRKSHGGAEWGAVSPFVEKTKYYQWPEGIRSTKKFRDSLRPRVCGVWPLGGLRGSPSQAVPKSQLEIPTWNHKEQTESACLKVLQQSRDTLDALRWKSRSELPRGQKTKTWFLGFCEEIWVTEDSVLFEHARFEILRKFEKFEF